LLLFVIQGDVPPLQLKVERVTPAGSSVRGVTSLGDKLFVVRHPCRQRIEVYDTTTLDLRCHIVVNGLKQSYGLASCVVNSCLYVSDYYRDAVYRVHIAITSSGDLTAITSWQVSGGPLGLSVTSSSRTVIVTCSSVHGQSKLKEYTSDGTLVRKIRLLSDLTYCCHAVEVANPAGHFAVSHGGDRQGLADVAAGCVYLVDADGRIVRCFGNRRNQALTLPRQLAISKLGCIVVADQQRGRLLLLGSSFASSRDMTVANEGGLKGPYALCLDESRSRLYVGEMNGGRIFAVTNWSM
jgi:sugar lactone lactonase YvrE